MIYRCPKCRKDTGLWRNVEVPAWEAVDAELRPARGGPGVDREVFWEQAAADGGFGCSECGWDGMERDLERISGVDRKPLPAVHPAQRQIEVSS